MTYFSVLTTCENMKSLVASFNIKVASIRLVSPLNRPMRSFHIVTSPAEALKLLNAEIWPYAILCTRSRDSGDSNSEIRGTNSDPSFKSLRDGSLSPIYVGGLSTEITHDQLADYFKTILQLNISTSDIIELPNSMSKGFQFLKIEVSRDSIPDILKPEVWPQDVRVNKFIAPRLSASISLCTTVKSLPLATNTPKQYTMPAFSLMPARL